LIGFLKDFLSKKCKNKLDIDELVTVVNGLLTMSSDRRLQFMHAVGKDLKAAHASILTFVNKRENVNIDQAVVDKHFNTLMKDFTESQREVFKVYNAISGDLATKFPEHYQHQVQQVYACTVMQTMPHRMNLAVIPPGGGKSMIILLTALYASTIENKKVYILTSTKYLEMQLDAMLKRFLEGH